MLSKAFRKHDGYLFYAYLILLLWAPLPLGSNRPWSAMLLCFCAAALLGAWLLLYLQDKVEISSAAYRARWAILALCAFQLWVFLQTLALPSSLMALMAPSALSHHQLAGFIADSPVSLNLDQSLKSAVLGLGLTLSFVLALLLINNSERKYLFYSSLVISGVIQACLGLLFVFANTELILEFEQLFHRHKPTASGTFVSSNHFAGYLNICLAIGVGLFVCQFKTRKYGSWRAFVRSMIETLLSSKVRLRIYLMLMLIALLVSLSRMGNFGFFIALSVASLLLLLRDRKFNLQVMLFVLSVVVIDIFIVSASFGLEELTKKVESTSLTSNVRSEINANSEPMIKEYFWVGAGAGAYQVIEPAFNKAPSQALTVHAHNDYYEFLINTGLIGFACLLAFLWCIVKALFEKVYASGQQALKYPDKSDFALVMLLVYLAVHSLVDFNLHIPAFSFTLLACLAMVYVRPACVTVK